MCSDLLQKGFIVALRMPNAKYDTIILVDFNLQSMCNPRHSRTCDPGLLSFKPIQLTTAFSLAPVEEPGFVY